MHPIHHHFRRIGLAALLALAGVAAAPVPGATTAQPDQWLNSASYVLFEPGSRGSTMSGSMEDVRRARSLRVGSEGLLYVRHGGAGYVIRDAATLRQARSIFEPQEALGTRQAQLGSRQAALGERQARLGAEQARLGLQQATSSPQRSDELDRQQEALGREQDKLGREQEVLGREQAKLGGQHERLARIADAKFRALLADALRRGVARRVH
jgi:hypothetical protein